MRKQQSRPRLDSPHACPGPWYGSCPTTTTLTLGSDVSLDQLCTRCCGGKTFVPALASCARNCLSCVKYGLCISDSRRANHLASIVSRSRASESEEVAREEEEVASGAAVAVGFDCGCGRGRVGVVGVEARFCWAAFLVEVEADEEGGGGEEKTLSSTA